MKLPLSLFDSLKLGLVWRIHAYLVCQKLHPEQVLPEHDLSKCLRMHRHQHW
jgi:hypothetical protein